MSSTWSSVHPSLSASDSTNSSLSSSSSFSNASGLTHVKSAADLPSSSALVHQHDTAVSKESTTSSAKQSTQLSSNGPSAKEPPVAESGFVRAHETAPYVTDTTGVTQSVHDAAAGFVPPGAVNEIRKRKLEEPSSSSSAQSSDLESSGNEVKYIYHPSQKRLHSLYLSDEAHTFFTTATVADLLRDKPKRPLIRFAHNKHVAQALKDLNAAGVLSAPVVLGASVEDTGDTDQFLGLFDALTLLRRVDAEIRSSVGEPCSAWMYDKELEKLIPSYADKMLITVCGDDDVSYVARGLESETLSQLITNCFFQRPTHPVHRVAVFGADGKVRSIISQSDVVRYVVKHMDRLGTLKDEPIEALGWGQLPVHTVEPLCTTSDAFRRMIALGVSSLGVVDSQGKLIANISASDLRGVEITEFHSRLTLPVLDFLALSLKDLTPITCKQSARVCDVLRLLASSGVHRVYVVDAQLKPVGIVTLTDVLRLIMRL